MPISPLPINANISEINDGPYYQVRLEWLPRVGELLDLYSYVEAANRQPEKRYYEVVQIIHQLRDITEKVRQSHEGSHFVTVLVRPSEDALFKD